MIQIEFLKNGKFTTSGSSVLKMIQNNTTPVLDLFVRESIQNSLDAKKADAKNVLVSFRYQSFDIDALSREFEVIGPELLKKYSGKDNKFLAVQDSNTVGLTGDLSGEYQLGEANQNLGKLVFHIMKPQENEGAGGSWGIGKTIYYRLGIGLVIYYSRVKLAEGDYQDRLVAALVEDETTKNGLLTSIRNNQGVAFFGDRTREETITTITDSKRITTFLSIFGLFPMTGDMTGTTIIIPFIDGKNLVQNNLPEDSKSKWWENDLVQYIKLSVLRWYFPRFCLNYPEKYGPKLIAMINGERICVSQETIIFEKFQDLYNACYSDNIEPWIKKIPITRSNNVESEIVGWFSYGKITAEELQIIKKHFPTPFEYCLMENSSSDRNAPLIAFTRQPGMVVNYTTSGDAVKSIYTNKDEYIIGVFSLNSENYISTPIRLNLDEYIRQGEKADHTSWFDHVIGANTRKIQIVNGIYKGIQKELNSVFGEKDSMNTESSVNRDFAKKFGKLLLPDENFGTAGSKRSSNTRSGGDSIHRKNSNKIELASKEFRNHELVLEYHFIIGKNVKRIIAVNYVNTINNRIAPQEFENDGLSYPCEIVATIAKEIRKSGRTGEFSNVSSLLHNGVEFAGFSFRYYQTISGKKYGFILESKTNNDEPREFYIRLRLKSIDQYIQTYFDFDIEEK